jgi:predicted PurR-regulated permease PerM
MSNPSIVKAEDETFVRRATEAAIRIAVLFVLVVFCYDIIRPFVVVVLWGIIIAVGVYPIFRRFKSMMKNKDKPAAVIMTIIALALLIIPSLMLAGSAINGVQKISTEVKEGTFEIPPPPAKVADWPVVGASLHSLWHLASTNLKAAVQKVEPQLREGASKVMSAAAGITLGLLQTLLSIIIAGIFLATAEAGNKGANAVFTRLAGDSGEELTRLAAATIRSVVQGVLGVALIQALASGIGLMLVGVPFAGLWALMVLMLAIIQLPPLVVLGPAAIYVFSTASTSVAVVFLVWAILVSMSDAFLKPLLLGRGVDVPMLVILLGAIGGMMYAGIVGLFMGAVILATGYKLFQAWLGAAKPVKA